MSLMRASSSVAVGLEWGGADLAVLGVDENLPLVLIDVEADDERRGRVELTRRIEEHVGDEDARVGRARELHGVRAQPSVRAVQLRQPLLGRTLALAAHGIDQPFAMQRGADE